MNIEYFKRVKRISEVKYSNGVNHYELQTEFDDNGNTFCGIVNKNSAKKLSKMFEIPIKLADKITIHGNGNPQPVGNDKIITFYEKPQYEERNYKI